ncbi:MAG: 3-hydroxy-5-phosphonooxypentane-2,4-dione thiolase [Elusimicrobia bacterium]|nr:3-hydroxy-5-phosphonooxypentane-2,4-dione thiolase [Elusimicrobiota bacterium]
MDWGIKNRISRIIKPKTGKTVMLAVDHGYFLGPTTGLEDARATVAPLAPYADAIMLTRGILRNCADPSWNAPIVLRVSGGASILTELSNETITVTMEEALRLNASAVTNSIFIGAPHEKESLVGLSHLVNEGARYGMPVLAVTAVGKDMKRDARYLGLACRIAAEMGAHFVKTYYCEDFEEIAKSCPVPLIVAGGKKTPELEALALTYQAIQKGAVGVDMGRNIFQSEHPAAMIRAVASVVHEKKSVNEAYALYKHLAGNGQPKTAKRQDPAKRAEKSASSPWD